MHLRSGGRPTRRSFLLPLTCLPALATGLALHGAGALLAAPPPPSDAATDEANATLVLRLCETVNSALRSGDPAPLATLLAADFVDRAAPPGLPLPATASSATSWASVRSSRRRASRRRS